ncbi:hypothetical protein GUH33_04510, partial [Xanthomonas citri pv. citri]|nr:hypothetical protein [Xanthomonas citri pv. citri]
TIFFIGAGAGASMATKLDKGDDIYKIFKKIAQGVSGSISTGSWIPFETENVCYGFDAFDNTYGQIWTASAGAGKLVEARRVSW